MRFWYEPLVDRILFYLYSVASQMFVWLLCHYPFYSSLRSRSEEGFAPSKQWIREKLTETYLKILTSLKFGLVLPFFALYGPPLPNIRANDNFHFVYSFVVGVIVVFALFDVVSTTEKAKSSGKNDYCYCAWFFCVELRWFGAILFSLETNHAIM